MSEDTVITCVNCGFDIDCRVYDEPNFCPNCGVSTKNYCPNCIKDIKELDEYSELIPTDKFCFICGSKTIYHDYLIDNNEKSSD